MKKKVGVVSLGCPKNLVDSEIMLGILNGDEFETTNNEGEAQIIIVNTCGFIDSAKKESIETILEMSKYKTTNCELLIVTGCLAERYKEDILKEIPEVDAIAGVGNYEEIAEIISEAYKGIRVAKYGKLSEKAYLENKRMLSTTNGFAYLKIAEGCDNCCTYCIIPKLRGKFRSRLIEDIIKEARWLADSGVKEVILVAQDTSRYGIDIYKEKKLVELIQKISEVEGIEAIRLLYCYPEEIDDALINELASNDKLCKYMDIPIQHISDRVLKVMGRRSTSGEIKSLLVKLREKVPGIILRTSLIVGFPGETEEDFEKLFNFVNDFLFDRMGVFIYSKEEGTPAAKLKMQIPKRIKEDREKRLLVLQNEISRKRNTERLNKVYKTLVEGVAEDGIFYYGRCYAEAPDIDGLIYFTSIEPLAFGKYVMVKILNIDDYDLIGEVIDESAE